MSIIRLCLFSLFAFVYSICFSQNFPVDSSYTTLNAWNHIHKYHPDAKIVKAELDKDILVERDLIYATINNSAYGKRDLRLDVFRPEKKMKYPALIMIHGGGWRSGNKTMEHAMAVEIARHGYVAIPVEYRLSLESSYPNAVYDIKAAIRWVKQNAEILGVDTCKIAIEGNSAGGQLASLVGLTNGQSKFEGNIGELTGKASINAIVDIDGVLNFMAPLSLNINRKSDSPDAIWLGGLFEEKPLIWKEASPAYWAGKNSVPILILRGADPRFTAGMYELNAIYNNNNIYCETQIIDNAPHTFWLFSPWYDKTIGFTVDFLNKVFKPKD